MIIDGLIATTKGQVPDERSTKIALCNRGGCQTAAGREPRAGDKRSRRARDLGIADKVGSLTPGERADLILVRTTISTWRRLTIRSTLVSPAQPSNVDTVLLDGRILRRNRQFAASDWKVAHDARRRTGKGTIDVRVRWFGASGGPP